MGETTQKNSIGEVRGQHPRWKDTLRLLREFHHIASSVWLYHRDFTMQVMIDQFIANWSNILELYRQLKPPLFMPLAPDNVVTNAKGANHGAGLVHPVNGTLDEWCRYAAHHFRPGGCSTPIGIGMDTASRVSYPHMWGYLLSLTMAPVTERNGIRGLYF